MDKVARCRRMYGCTALEVTGTGTGTNTGTGTGICSIMRDQLGPSQSTVRPAACTRCDMSRAGRCRASSRS